MKNEKNMNDFLTSAIKQHIKHIANNKSPSINATSKTIDFLYNNTKLLQAKTFELEKSLLINAPQNQIASLIERIIRNNASLKIEDHADLLVPYFNEYASVVQADIDNLLIDDCHLNSKIHIHTIAYENEHFNISNSLFLDNTMNLRPDWREYWPIRNFLLNNNIADEEFYGFFSPKFYDKTLVSFDTVKKYVSLFGEQYDVISFSPFYEQSVFFDNIFQQGDFNHPNLLETTIKSFISIDADISMLLNLSSCDNIIFSNYFVAKGKFFKRWLAICEKLFLAAEDNQSYLGHLLRKNANYHQGQTVEMKVFIMERMCSYLIEKDKFSCKRFPPLKMFLLVVMHPFIRDIVFGGCLKDLYLKTSSPSILNAYNAHKKKLLMLWKQYELNDHEKQYKQIISK